MIATWIVALAVATPQQPAPVQSPASVVVRLDVGTELTGRIVTETADYLELELATGTRVGFPRARALAITAVAESDDHVAANTGGHGRDEWYLLHDGEGRSVGWLHDAVVPDPSGGTRFSQEWRFFDASGATEITLLEVVDARRAPVSCFYHERRRASDDDRVRDERLVRAVVTEARIEVVRKSIRDEAREVYDFAAGTRFPLELRDELRQRTVGAPARFTHLLFDPGREQFVTEVFEVGQHRRVAIDGRQLGVRVLEAETASGVNAEWLDAAHRTVRREINGPCLVAVPVPEADARREAERRAALFPPALGKDPGSRFSMWVPNPLWRFVDDGVVGQITARAELEDATVSLVEFGHFDRDETAEAATDSVLRWLRLLHGDLSVDTRAVVPVRGQPAVRVTARFSRTDAGRVDPRRLAVFVLRVGGSIVALSCEAPRHSFARLEADFERILASVELHGQGVSPQLQGPVRPRALAAIDQDRRRKS